MDIGHAFGLQVERRPYRFPDPPIFNKGDIMPASKAELDDLRGLLWYFENPKTHLPDVERRRYAEALRRMITLLEHGDPQSPVWWVAGALRKAMRRVAPGIYITQDRALETWALDQIFDMFPEE